MRCAPPFLFRHRCAWRRAEKSWHLLHRPPAARGGLAFSARSWWVESSWPLARAPLVRWRPMKPEDGWTGGAAEPRKISVGGWGACACQWMGTAGPVSCQRRAGSVAVRRGTALCFAFGGGMCCSAGEQKEWRLQVCVAPPALRYASRVQILFEFLIRCCCCC